MWVSWFIFGLSMIFINRWFTHLTNKSNYIHAVFGIIIVILNAYAALDIIIYNGLKTEGLHNNVGLICFYGLLAFALTGIITMVVKRNLILPTSHFTPE
jgi:fumarate reductase subunit D